MEIIRRLEEEEEEQEEVAAEGDRGGYSGLLSEKLTCRLAHVPRPGRICDDAWSFGGEIKVLKHSTARRQTTRCCRWLGLPLLCKFPQSSFEKKVNLSISIKSFHTKLGKSILQKNAHAVVVTLKVAGPTHPRVKSTRAVASSPGGGRYGHQ